MDSLNKVLWEILLTPLVGAMMERGIKPARKVKCECVTEFAMNGNPDRLMEFADGNCPLCDGDGFQKRERPVCAECGDERCAHGGCRDPHCKNFCHRCQRERDAASEAAYQRDVAGPLLGLEGEGNRG